MDKVAICEHMVHTGILFANIYQKKKPLKLKSKLSTMDGGPGWLIPMM